MIIIKNGMFYVLDSNGKGVACFRSMTRLLEYVTVTAKYGSR